ncbi:MAG: acyl-CoA synthetase [Lysobacterales bacterium]
MKLTDYHSYADAQAHFSAEALWALFDGDRAAFNIAHECVDRHADSGRTALIIIHAEGEDEIISYRELARLSARFAHWLQDQGIAPGDRVAVMLEPSLAFYVAVFGALKAGAIAVPMFTLFGPEALDLRLRDCEPRLLIHDGHSAASRHDLGGTRGVHFDAQLLRALQGFPEHFEVRTSAADLAVYQYTSGTTRELPEAVRHAHRTLVTLMVAALYGTGIRPGERFLCPSSPAWGHGLWHGTFAPLALGLTVGSYAGKFDAERLLQALQTHRFDNLSAAATHYRMLRNCARVTEYSHALRKLSFTGEPMDPDTASFVRQHFGLEACSMYGTTELGVVLVNYPGAADYTVKSGSLGRPPPAMVVEVQHEDGSPCAIDETGFLMVQRRGQWVPTRDLARQDADGHYFHGGRADDVIISAGWTMSAVEIENAILGHPDVLEAAAIGVADPLRGEVVKAFVVSARPADETFAEEIQQRVKSRLSLHEYPRQVAFVGALPKTPAGKVNRRVLREAERAGQADPTLSSSASPT